MNRFLALVVIALVVGSLPALAVTDSQKIQTDNREALNKILADCEANYRLAEMDPIRDKVDLSGRGSQSLTARLQANTNYPNEAERGALAFWAPLRQGCVRLITNFLDTAPLPAGANRDTATMGNSFLIRSMTATGDLVTALAQGKLTFGDYARRRAELVSRVDSHYARWHGALKLSDPAKRAEEAAMADRLMKETLQKLADDLSKAKVQEVAMAPPPLKFAKGPPRPNDIAVIIGNGDYTRQARDIPDVRPAHADADSVKAYVSQALGVLEGNIIELKDATAAQMARVFGSRDNPRGQLYDWVKPGQSRVFIYYAGHGSPGTDGAGPYLVPADADAARIGLSGYPLAVLYDNLGRLPAEKVTVVLESCFSGQSQSGPLVTKASPIILESKAWTVPANVTVIAAAASNQIANWEPDEGRSLFTEYFLKGMAGAADKAPYGNGDGEVTLDELDHYLKDTLTYYARRFYGRDQIAQIVRGATP